MWSNTEHRHNTEFSVEFQLDDEDAEFEVTDVYLIKAILYISINYIKQSPPKTKSFKITEIV